MSTNPRPRAGPVRRVVWASLLVVAALAAGLVQPAHATVLPGHHQLVNQWSHECLTVVDGLQHNGAEVRIDRCRDALHQRWQKVPASTSPWREIGLVQLQAQHSGKCLSVQGPGRGANVVQDVCESRFDQLWMVVPSANGYSKLQMFLPGGMCLDKAGGDVTIWDCWDTDWQRWTSLG